MDDGENQYIKFKVRIAINCIQMLVSVFANADGGFIIFCYDEIKNKKVYYLSIKKSRELIIVK